MSLMFCFKNKIKNNSVSPVMLRVMLQVRHFTLVSMVYKCLIGSLSNNLLFILWKMSMKIKKMSKKSMIHTACPGS